jgi:hypothetical protein
VNWNRKFRFFASIIPRRVNLHYISVLSNRFELLTVSSAAVILDASSGSATEVVLQSLSVHLERCAERSRSVVAIPYTEKIAIGTVLNYRDAARF